jgi:phospholipid/cholesterol/gamma-HCH transport system substrate-binding protein
MKIRDLMSFIALGVAIALTVGYFASLGVRIRPPAHRTNISMTVADINGLVVDANVLLRGVPVGKVAKIQSSIDGANVDFYIDGRFHVPVDSEVRLDNLSALGESYIELVPRSQKGPMLHDGQRIATESVIQPPSISELATSVVRLVNQLDPGALERVIGEADTALPPPNSVLPNLSHANVVLRNTAADMHSRGRELLDNFQTLLRNAGWVGPVLGDLTPLIYDLFHHAQIAFSLIPTSIHHGAPQSYRDLSKLITRIQRLLDNNGGDLKLLGEAFSPHIKGIAGALMNFDSGQILANVLASLPEDGAITLHVAVPTS